MKKTIWTLVILVVILGAIYMYITRPLKIESVAVPTTPTSQATSTPNPTPTSTSTMVKSYTVDNSQSTATYTLGEKLNGKPFTVVGKTSSITGTVKLDMVTPKNSMVSLITIDARTFKTDSEKRDNAVVRLILKSENTANTYITFMPKEISGAPTTITPGQEYSFKVTGDLTVAGVTKSQTFDVKAKMDATTISGTATGSVKRSDYNLIIPNIPFVANVDQTVKLAFDFVLK